MPPSRTVGTSDFVVSPPTVSKATPTPVAATAGTIDIYSNRSPTHTRTGVP
jgi:hypothetical protein